jgi:DhnA family fructose-bisphosphate aldolase class Ia
MPITGESIRLSRLFSDGKNAVIVAVDHGLYFGPLSGMINLPESIDRVSKADAILMAPGMPAHCQSVFSKRGAPALIIRLNWGSNYAAMWNYKHSHSVPMISAADAVAQGADLVISSLSLKNPDEAEDAHNVEVFSACVAQARTLGIPMIGEVYPTGGDDYQPEDLQDEIFIGCRIIAELGANLVKTSILANASRRFAPPRRYQCWHWAPRSFQRKVMRSSWQLCRLKRERAALFMVAT